MVQEQMRACDMLPKYAGVDARYQCTQFSWSGGICATGGGSVRGRCTGVPEAFVSDCDDALRAATAVPREGAQYVGDVLCGIDADGQPHQQNARNAAIPAALWRCRACAGFLRPRRFLVAGGIGRLHPDDRHRAKCRRTAADGVLRRGGDGGLQALSEQRVQDG